MTTIDRHAQFQRQQRKAYRAARKLRGKRRHAEMRARRKGSPMQQALWLIGGLAACVVTLPAALLAMKWKAAR